ncbi:KRE11-like protein [Scheffersomyces stipitis CBS 6054]|uniref:KRE11-like protein n=1 Tax=Scheffersomyces stipitis (strain ATCC 58785 / CBS 6054 / NBRC 10063 / NRRL Y-11545) TaxID=322104 RepID=A3GFY1_PICST|nr:KRE11-like protein [Scheffersomyces stipitis CBS 6054]EAZ63423.2 KRE11-like protein [Scheffersomyces stipitis CBS 6054]
MSISIVLPSNPDRLRGVTDIDKFLFVCNPSASTRRIVFFDESIVGYIVYQGQELPSHRSQVYLDVTILPADIVENQNPEKYLSLGSAAITDLLLKEENLIFDNVESQANGNHYSIWRFEVPIIYPRRRFSNPILFLSCAIHDSGTDNNLQLSTLSLHSSDECLPDYLPGRANNLIAEMNNQISKSADNNSILENTTINTQSLHELKASIRIPVSVSLVIRIKSTKPAGRNNLLLATLNIESSEELSKLLVEVLGNTPEYYFNISSLSMDFKYGDIKEIKTDSLRLPLRFKSSDSINFTYKLTNNENADSNNYMFSRPVNIKLVVQIQKYIPKLDTYENLSGTITTSWSPYLDFSIIAPPINSSLKTTNTYSQQSSASSQTQPVVPTSKLLNSTRKSAMINSLYKLKSPNPTTYSANNIMGTLGSNSSVNTSASSVTVNLTTNNNSTLTGLKLNFKGKLNIKLGEVNNWKIQAINNSPSRLNLSLLVQNPINFNPIYNSGTTSNNVSSSNLLNSEAVTGQSNASNDIIVYNKFQLYSLYNSLKMNTNGVIILNNDIRIGPLDSNTVFETDIKLIGISKGIFNLDGIKIFDINSGDGLDFGKLVEVFVI